MATGTPVPFLKSSPEVWLPEEVETETSNKSRLAG